jgi:outer membrane receptor for ferrienterochelin and colicin
MKSAPRAASSIANWPSRLPRSITITRTSSCRTRGPARSRSCSTRKSESYGFEGEATYRASSRFSLNASVGYLHATYKELTLSGTNLAGNDLPFAPRWTAQGGFDWAPFDIAGGPLTFSPNINYVSRQFFSPFNAVNAAGGSQVNSELQQGSYVKVNGAITWTHGNLTLRGWVQNLLQERPWPMAWTCAAPAFRSTTSSRPSPVLTAARSASRSDPATRSLHDPDRDPAGRER